MLRKYDRPGREREGRDYQSVSVLSLGLITDTIRLGRERIPSEPDDLGLRDAVLGQGEDGRVVRGEVELELWVDVESVCKENIKDVREPVRSSLCSPELFRQPPAVTPLCQAPE